jgi:glycosyltransferase involved in cell wall biosynthesis
VRPYLRHATAVVAPLRIARGIQNKVLESMAMARPTVVTPAALEGIDAVPGEELLLAADAEAFAGQVIAVSEGRVAPAIGSAARRRVELDFDWDRNLSGFQRLLEGRTT